MKKGLNLFLIMALVLAVFVMPSISFAAHAVVGDSVTATDVYEIDNMTPGSSKTFLGTRLRGTLQKGGTASAACTTSHAACNNVATTADKAVYVKTTGALLSESWALANGYENQEVTFVLSVDGGVDFYVTPTTKTGFTSVQLNDAKDSVTLKYINSTIGWVVTGNNAATIN